MDIQNLYTIAKYNSKLLVRTRLFKIFLLISFSAIVFFQVYYQTTLIQVRQQGIVITPPPPPSLDSFMPYINLCLLLVFQTISFVFIPGIFTCKESQKSSLEAIYSRPESNSEYIWGICFGVFRLFFFVAVISLTISALLQVFSSPTHFNVLVYLFYLFTLFLPAMVFTFGISICVSTVTGNQLLSTTLLLLFALGAFFMSRVGYGFFDVLGFSLPNTFSEMTGFPRMASYLLQRGCWFFLGLGFIQLTVFYINRIPNNYKRFTRFSVIALFWGLGIFLGSFYVFMGYHELSRRELYTKTYDQYARIDKASMLSQNIDYVQNTNRINVTSQVLLQNRNDREMEEIILYLNPALDITSVSHAGKELLYDREYQVIRVKKNLSPGDTVSLQICYKGQLDENVCYLDVSQNKISDQATNSIPPFYFGKFYHFLTEDFTLLIPEILWYPVTSPPVNPASPNNLPNDFTRFVLRVHNPEKKTVISQGEKAFDGERVTFTNTSLLPGISLCIGEYETKSIVVDSVTYELNVFKSHVSGLDVFQSLDSDFLTKFLVDYKYKTENNMNREYPFDRFILAETPVSFASYFRNTTGKTEFVQPELVFLPEKGIGIEMPRRNLSPKKNFLELVFDRFFIQAQHDKTPLYDVMKLLKTSSRPRVTILEDLSFNASSQNNPYYISALFFNNTFLESDDYPCMDMIFKLAQRNKKNDEYDDFAYVQDALHYLSTRSLEDALKDDNVLPGTLFKILSIKSKQLINTLAASSGTESDTIISFIDDFTRDINFRKYHFSALSRAWMDNFGINLQAYVDEWYTRSTLPSYLVSDCVFYPQQRLRNDGKLPVYVEFSVFNDSDVDGVIVLGNQQSHSSRGGLRVSVKVVGKKAITFKRSYSLKAGEGKRVAFMLEDVPQGLSLNLNPSVNLPTRLRFSDEMGTDFSGNLENIEEAVDRSYFLPAENEIVIDNEDSGCMIPVSTWTKIKNYLQKNDELPSYQGKDLLSNPPMEWKKILLSRAYGNPIKSAMCCAAGNNGLKMEWNAELDKDGFYEVYAYIPNKMILRNELRVPLEVIQTYIISYGNGKEEKKAVDISNKVGWVLLGKYHFSPGSHSVVLLNEGRASQSIVGDAVKWVYVTEWNN